MKRTLVLTAAFLFTITASLVRADVITAKQAAQHVGEIQTVRGVVVSARYAARSKGQPTFLNLDQPYPDTIFTVVIWGCVIVMVLICLWALIDVWRASS